MSYIGRRLWVPMWAHHCFDWRRVLVHRQALYKVTDVSGELIRTTSDHEEKRGKAEKESGKAKKVRETEWRGQQIVVR
jgi:hypothetical protein